jgi:hypothetical protein
MCLFNTLLFPPQAGRSSWWTPQTALLLIAAAALLALPAGAFQTPQAGSPAPSDATAHPAPHHHHVKSLLPQATPKETTTVPAPAEAAAPETPHWPVNETPGKPEITWDSHGLRIAASNSSLHTILDEVSTATGAKVEGLGADERVFGDYGPGDARDVLSQLLHGSGYNVLMIGDQGKGTPREIVLSTRHAAGGSNQGGASRSGNSDMQDDDTPEQPEPDDQGPPPQLMRPPMIPQQGPQGAAGPPRTPQQLLQELQQRQQEMQNQQQQMPQQPIPSPPQQQ